VRWLGKTPARKAGSTACAVDNLWMNREEAKPQGKTVDSLQSHRESTTEIHSNPGGQQMLA
jgi:hypothetical protein